MLKKTMLATAALALSAAPIAAQAAAPAPRAPAGLEQADQLHGTTAWVLAAIGLGLLIWGIIELTDDEEPDSP